MAQLVGACSIGKKLPAAIVGSAAIAFLFVFAFFPPAQAQKPIKPPRHLVLNVAPEYPATLRSAHVGGLVRLNVTVSPNGNVTRIDLLGGNPIFSESAIKAVTKWKYAAAAAATTMEVEIRFNPDIPDSH